jgi:hypothetical protein
MQTFLQQKFPKFRFLVVIYIMLSVLSLQIILTAGLTLGGPVTIINKMSKNSHLHIHHPHHPQSTLSLVSLSRHKK